MAVETGAEGGDVDLQYKLGVVLERSPALGEPGEFRHWLAMAANNGIGDGVPHSPAIGKALAIKVANQGHVEARMMLMFQVTRDALDRLLQK